MGSTKWCDEACARTRLDASSLWAKHLNSIQRDERCAPARSVTHRLHVPRSPHGRTLCQVAGCRGGIRQLDAILRRANICGHVSKPSTRENLLRHGLRLVHERGFGAASVRDIVQASDAAQGSFTNHFASKEAFGLELIERYYDMTSAAVAATLRNDELPPLARLRAWMTNQLHYLRRHDMRRGCLYGNLAIEASEHSEPIRARIAAIFAENRKSVAYCLNAAVAAGELDASTEPAELAGFIVSSMQGAILVAKAERDPAAVHRFIKLLFSTVLRVDTPPSRKKKVDGHASRRLPAKPSASR
jgi:TetR/AcrR family transcriptional repressor of nem operon